MDTMLDIPYDNVKHIELSISDNVKMALHNRINELFTDKPSAKNIELAKFCKVSRATVTDWRNGNTKTINGDNAFSVARFFGANPEWVQNGKGEKYQNQPCTGMINMPKVKGKVPLFSFAQVGNWSEADFNFLPATGCEMVDVKVEVKARTFAVLVSGDSMEPEFSANGDFVVVEPDLPYKHESYVLAKKDNDVFIRQVYNEGGDWLLKPCNKDYKPKPIEEYQIIGVIREKTKLY